MVQGVNLEINYEDGNNERGWSSPLAIGGTILPTLISPNAWPGGDGWVKQASDGLGLLACKTGNIRLVL